MGADILFINLLILLINFYSFKNICMPTIYVRHYIIAFYIINVILFPLCFTRVYCSHVNKNM